MINLEFAPQLGQQNPSIYDGAFGGRPTETLGDIGLAVTDYLGETAKNYSEKDSNPLLAIESSDTSAINCLGRATFAHTLISAHQRFYPAIVNVHVAQYSSHHFCNVVLDTENGEIVVIDNSKKRLGKQEVGVTEIITDPMLAKHTPTEVYGPVFKVAMEGITQLYKDSRQKIVRTPLVHAYAPVDSEFISDQRVHLTREQVAELSPEDAAAMEMMLDTNVTVINFDASNRLVDRVAYGRTAARTVA